MLTIPLAASTCADGERVCDLVFDLTGNTRFANWADVLANPTFREQTFGDMVETLGGGYVTSFDGRFFRTARIDEKNQQRAQRTHTKPG